MTALNILEIYSTSSQFGDVARSLGHAVTSIKIDFDAIPTELSEGNYDLVWYMPECSYYSIASIGTHWNRDNTPKTDRTAKAYNHLQVMSDQFEKVLDRNLTTRIFIENPVGKMRKLPVFGTMIRHTLTQCQYGANRMKPTDIWTTDPNWKPLPRCQNGDSCHESAPRGSRKGTQGRKTKLEKAQLPEKLIAEILEGIK